MRHAYPDWTIGGHVVATIPTADRAKATVKVRVGFDERDDRVLPDMGVRVSFLTDGAEASSPAAPQTAVVVPLEAVQASGDTGFVFVIRDDTLARRAVRLARLQPRDRRFLPASHRARGWRSAISRSSRTAFAFASKTRSESWQRSCRSRTSSKATCAVSSAWKCCMVSTSKWSKGSFWRSWDLRVWKTTLLNLIGGLDSPDTGEITVVGERLDTLSSSRLAKWRARNVGFVFQFYNLLPVLTAERNVEVPLLLTKLSAKERKRNVRAALELVVSPTGHTTSLPSFRVDSSNASQSPGQSCPIRNYSSAMSRQGI